MKTFLSMGAVVAALGFALPAFAQDDDDMAGIELSDSTMTLEEADLSVALEGGLSSFTGGLAEGTEAGALWGVRLGADTDIVGAELAYVGSKNGFEDARVPETAALYRHEIEGLAKAGVRVGYGLKPFVGAGIGYSYVNVTDDAEPLYRNDFIFQIPLAAGVDWNRGPLHAGIRAGWSFLLGDEFAEPTPEDDNPDAGLFTTSLVVGGSF
jgi:hypothetical protein